MIVDVIQKDFENARKAVTELVRHFSASTYSCGNFPETPYFDPLHGRPIDRNRITTHWIQHLSNNIRNDFDGFLETSKGLIVSYHDCVRKTVFAVEGKRLYYNIDTPYVLMEYEQLLGELLVHDKKEYGKLSECGSNQDSFASSISYLHEVMSIITGDIFSLTAKESIYGSYERSRQNIDELRCKKTIVNVLLPTLLRIVEHMLDLLKSLICIQQTYTIISKENKEKIKVIIFLALVVALSFVPDVSFDCKDDTEKQKCRLSSENFNIFELLPSNLSKDFNLRNIATTEKSILPLEAKISRHMIKLLKLLMVDDRESVLRSNDFQDCIINFDSESSYLSMAWMDHSMGIGQRSGAELLRKIKSVLLCCTEGEVTQIRLNNNTSTSIALSVIGVDRVSKYIRANFFGRLHQQVRSCDDKEKLIFTKDGISDESLTFNGIMPSHEKTAEDFMVTKHQPKLVREEFHDVRSPMKQEPFEIIPSRIVSSLRVLVAFERSLMSADVWTDVLPIVYSLVDSIHSHNQSFGASLFIHLFGEQSSTSFLVSGVSRADICNDKSIEVASCIFSSGKQACRDPLSFFLISVAHRNLLDVFSSKTLVSVLSREITKNSLYWIQKNLYIGPGGDEVSLKLILSVMLSELQPLSETLARKLHADGMELGTFGLIALVPYIRWDSTSVLSKKVQCAAILCLISHMMSSYPVMKMHGGKVMSELLSCLGRAYRDLECLHLPERERVMCQAVVIMACHAASIAYNLCGKRAQDVISKVRSEKYKSFMIDICALIPLCSEDLIAIYGNYSNI